MGVRAIILALAGVLGFSLMGGPTTAQTPAANLTGTWNVIATGSHFQSGTYRINQVNDVVTGITAPVSGQVSAQFDGKANASGLIEGSWRGPTGETGWFNMRLAADGKAFSGQYGYNGRKAEGTLIGRLVPQSAATVSAPQTPPPQARSTPTVAPPPVPVAQTTTPPPPADFGKPPSGEVPILFNDRHVYTTPDRLNQNRVLAALVRGNEILVPLRSMFEQMGATVSYDPASKTADIAKPGSEVKVTVGKPEVVINGESRPLDVPPEIYKGAILVPVRVISEGMGAYVQWVPDKNVVVVRYVAAQVPTPRRRPPLAPTAPPTPRPDATADRGPAAAASAARSRTDARRRPSACTSASLSATTSSSRRVQPVRARHEHCNVGSLICRPRRDRIPALQHVRHDRRLWRTIRLYASGRRHAAEPELRHGRTRR